MKPAWDQLGAEYQDSKTVVIADVDCTVEKELCEQQGVSGYPTIKYWVDGKKEDYSGGRDLAALQNFVGETLEKLPCLIDDAEATCDKMERKFLKKWTGKSGEDLATEGTRLDKLKGNKFVKDPKKIRQKSNVIKQLQKK
eukprot:NODE_1754_length_851_cov_241.501247_g1382_i0.p2 GENE.NODE_1754_length_851_cov_241.501247_g1382_i0~~NODE_1754_length_851_cov_241.501247_g1382_i0.p2  ORF type:complete len:140 (+),score=42.63 NODE_1754_length_851_cov_241.501247_g1382_i0:208-627(+)